VTSTKKKILILLPDGVSLRNFAYTSFYKMGIEKGYEVVFWNATPFDLESLGFSQVALPNQKIHWLTDIFKNTRKQIEIRLFAKRDKDPIYFEYLFPLSYKSVKAVVKSTMVRWFTFWNTSEHGLKKVCAKMINLEKKTPYYQACLKVLEREQPDLVFCASQRSVIAIAPLTAAKALGIPTTTFIFSWDNVPKATTVVTTDYYLVWSDLMKRELLHYHLDIDESQIKVTGTPQFEPHYEKERLQTREDFCQQYQLDPNAKYLCYSGDDHTTSPKDELYLRDVAKAIRDLNALGKNVKMIFRRCPVDFSGRHDTVLKEFEDVLVDIPPLWKKIGGSWNTILPTAEDLNLQANIIAHTEGVINLASSMVFDYVAHGKPCAYMNYNYLNPAEEVQKGMYLYDYVHFRSMPSKEAVIWMNTPEEIAQNIQRMLGGASKTVAAAQQWFEIINLHSPTMASERIWDQFKETIN